MPGPGPSPVPATIDLIEEGLKAGAPVQRIARHIGVGDRRLNRWADSLPEVMALVAKRRDGTWPAIRGCPWPGEQKIPERAHLDEEQVVALLEAAAKTGNVQACRLLLERIQRRTRAQTAPPEPEKTGSTIIDMLAARRQAQEGA